MTHRGRWRRVMETHRSVRPLVHIRGHGHPGLTVSPEHPFYARRRQDKWDNSARRYERILQPVDWAPASMLDRGWYWASPTKFPASPVPPVGGRGADIDLRLMWLIPMTELHFSRNSKALAEMSLPTRLPFVTNLGTKSGSPPMLNFTVMTKATFLELKEPHET